MPPSDDARVAALLELQDRLDLLRQQAIACGAVSLASLSGIVVLYLTSRVIESPWIAIGGALFLVAAAVLAVIVTVSRRRMRTVEAEMQPLLRRSR